ncbi:MAG TPA: ORF6N domain-containing protein [Chthoniobacterales bacterium]|nr:ORF6N domain-containing protein [Chthoniobacterales bacterium]
MPSKQLTLSNKAIDDTIREIRGVRVIIDADLAALYGVPTKRLNEQFRRNRHRFPADFAFQLTSEEAVSLRSQIATGSSQTIDPQGRMRSRSQIATLKRGQNIKYRPYAFTEHGALQAANILNSKRAVRMSVFVIRAFVKMRDELSTNATIVKRLAQIDNTLFLHDAALRDLFQKLRPLLAPPPEPPRKQIGFSLEK